MQSFRPPPLLKIFHVPSLIFKLILNTPYAMSNCKMSLSL